MNSLKNKINDEKEKLKIDCGDSTIFISCFPLIIRLQDWSKNEFLFHKIISTIKNSLVYNRKLKL